MIKHCEGHNGAGLSGKHIWAWVPQPLPLPVNPHAACGLLSPPTDGIPLTSAIAPDCSPADSGEAGTVGFSATQP